MASAAAIETHLDEKEEDDDEEEYEYEEVEVEEEIIEEIEVEVDEDEDGDDDDDDMIGEPLIPINKEIQEKDNSPSKDPERHEVHMKSGSSIPEEFIVNPPDDPVLEGYKDNPEVSASSERSKQAESSGHRTPDKISDGESGVKNAEIMKHSAEEMVSAVGAQASIDGVKEAENMKRSAGELVSAVADEASIERGNGVQYCEEETDGIAAKEAVDISKRSDPIQIRQRSLSPELNDGSKRAAIICDFFAKGWCIKGKSCRFLHIRDKVADTSQLKEGDVDAAKQKSEPSVGEVSSVATNSAWDDGARGKWKSEDAVFLSLKDDPGSNSSPNFFGRESLGQRSYLDHYGHYAPPLIKDSSRAYTNGSLREAFSGNPLISSCTQKLPESGQGYQASVSSSIQRSSSPFPGSGSAHHSRINFSGETQRPADYKTNISFGNWEPSVPFRPSYPITQRLLSANLYDPICDSTEKTNSGGVYSQSSLCGQGASKDSTKLQEIANKASAGTLCAEYSSTSNLQSSHIFHDNKTGGGLFEKDRSTRKSKIEETAVAEQQSRNSLPKEEKSSNSPQARDFREQEKINNDSESALQRDISKHSAEPKIDRARQNDHADSGIKNDNTYAQDSKALKIFHVALVECVKEILRPTWHEGLLSRDAHKLIVKKTVDKVLGTLQPHQIPNTSELVEQYLMVSQAKLANLVEAYVEKYGKS